MAYLTISTKEGVTKRVELRTAIARIGRAAQSDIVLSDVTVTREEHARIERRPDGNYLIHGGGRNGTILNDLVIDEAVHLKDGDQIRVGNTLLFYNSPAVTSVEFGVKKLPEGTQSEVVNPADFQSSLSSTPDISSDPSDRSPLELILEADRELALHRPLRELFETILDLAHRVAPFERGVLFTWENGELVQRIARVPSDQDGTTLHISTTIRDRVLKNREAFLVPNVLEWTELGEINSIHEARVRSFMCVPLWNDTGVTGLLYVDNHQAVGQFTRESLHLLTHLAHVAAIKLENRQLIDKQFLDENLRKELDRAAEIQRDKLPDANFEIPGYQLYAKMDPCYMVGGDYYDYVACGDDCTLLCLGDVAGKGLSASLLMSAFQASYRSLVLADLSLTDFVRALHGFVSEWFPFNRQMTLFTAQLCYRTHKLTYINAGHPPVLHIGGGEVRCLKATDPLLGCPGDFAFETHTVSMEPGDVLISYSDGFTEAENAAEEHFGLERLIAAARKNVSSRPSTQVKLIRAEVDRHTDEHPQGDDLTMMVLQREK